MLFPHTERGVGCGREVHRAAPYPAATCGRAPGRAAVSGASAGPEVCSWALARSGGGGGEAEPQAPPLDRGQARPREGPAAGPSVAPRERGLPAAWTGVLLSPPAPVLRTLPSPRRLPFL